MKRRRNSTFWIFWISLSAFVVLSTAAGLKLLYGFDLWALNFSQNWANSVSDRVGELFSTLGSLEVTAPAFATLVIWLFLVGRRTLAVRLAVAMFVASLVEFAMKLWLPQVPMPEDATRTTGYAPVLDVPYSYPYPSGHMLRSMLLLGAVFLLWRNRFARLGIVVVLVGMAVSRVYLGVHWASDVIGGALLGLAGLAWAFGHSKGGVGTWR